jgi:uncharacterized membrane protein YedE/YeeE
MEKHLDFRYLAVAAVGGLLFGLGLYVSQMVDPLKVLHFLDFKAIPTGGWDPSLAFVMGVGLIVMFGALQIGKRWQKPLFDSAFHNPTYTRIDSRLLLGSAIFGIGWGMSGICPGPAISLIAFWPPNLLVYLVALFIGSYGGTVLMPSDSEKRLALAR